MEDDPGWPWARKSGSNPASPLIALRTIFAAQFGGVVIFSFIVTYLIVSADRATANPSVGIALGMLGFGVLLQLVLLKFERPLDSSSEESLVASYRGRFVIRASVAVAVSLTGLVGSLVALQLWAVALTVLSGGFGFVRAAPTGAAVQRDEERLQAQGSPHSLTAALRG